MACKAQTVLFKEYVEVGEVPPDNFQLRTIDLPALKDGEVLLELQYLSVDPYMRGRMRNAAGYFVGPFVPGEALSGGGVVVVKESKAPGIEKGKFYSGMVPWTSPQIATKAQMEQMQPVDTDILKLAKLPLSGYAGVFGLTGMTAYASLTRIGKPKKGETVFVSGAAGAVGMIVGQMCKNVYGCKVVGSAGSEDKVEFLTKELGFDAAWNYKTMPTLDALNKFCPEGIDMYYENVGGEQLEAALEKCRENARIVCCGMISQYNKKGDDRYGVKNLANVVFKKIKMEGFLLFQFLPEVVPEFFEHFPKWIAEGKIKDTEYVVKGGLANAGQAFCDMMAGKNKGKAVVKCVDKDPIVGN
uniref:NADPH dependent alkenal/alkenone reductase n=1 Tax=Dunaliella salina TaxID=3046 RepID=B8Y209_DUNSA|nr:NADPH dependent alkenal/alkenone reductase [Dunaliella salina]|mmetsp:Transcript_14104/g.38122  ORF Transcript_14104/g.38122 Transcript_14104/m.38122 type:complete len:357 (-) Transcript_14104:463-1533(-)|eukprot:CAMPEP_0202351326 /NCGR_PEP_ID=MMETSP1126-20121109/8019_1 /ASSEMBLY_ACC=CAM_ASM_000457 /TAXON_ID=3047 /ORGANISM="Dunaliella tertiolecta, Strain CCMP1320" /LENGTH=356 /DNA_ID=CAMNT_0048943427 /DNA_START=70 /DNA_END=1140 /DNA_ORIENTATION=+